MRALVAGGDRAGALQHARIYEVLMEQELEPPPDREVVDLAAELRSGEGQPRHADSFGRDRSRQPAPVTIALRFSNQFPTVRPHCSLVPDRSS